MSCRYCVNGKIELFTSIVDCLECQPVQKYPELAEGRFFFIESDLVWQLPTQTWVRVPAIGWGQVSSHVRMAGPRVLYALPGPQPTHAPDDAPVLDRPPFGAWGDRFYFMENESLYAHMWLDKSTDMVRCTVNETPLPRDAVRFLIARHMTAPKSGATAQEAFDWLEAQRC